MRLFPAILSTARNRKKQITINTFLTNNSIEKMKDGYPSNPLGPREEARTTKHGNDAILIFISLITDQRKSFEAIPLGENHVRKHESHR